MLLVHPHYLWLLPLSLVAAWPGRRDQRRWAVAALRGLLVALIILALARPFLRTRGPQQVTVACVDLGPTGPPDVARLAGAFVQERRRSDADVRVVAFSNRSVVLRDPTILSRAADAAGVISELATPVATDDPAAGGSALADALRLCGAQIPPGVRGTIELWSPGLPTRGDAEAEALRLSRRGVDVRVTAAPVRTDLPPAVVRGVRVAGQARANETVTAEIDVDARQVGPATLTLAMSPGRTIKQQVNLAAGAGRLSLPLTLRTPGVTTIDASLDGGVPIRAAVAVGAAASVLVVRDPRQGDGAGLNVAALLGGSAAVTVVSPAVLERAEYDAAAVVLDGVGPDALSPAAQQSLRDRADRGMGLLLLAGADSVPGADATGPLASVWPVRLPRQAQQIEPSTALVLILDTSGSMQGEPLNLAKEVGRLAISHLRPTDKVGIVEFYGGRRWAYPIQPVGDGVGVNRALARLTPGGASDLFPAVEEAGFALRNVSVQVKHVMILSDGFVTGGPFASRVRQMADDGIVTSAVQIGQNDEGRLMASVALWGGGRFYTVPDRFALPDVSLKQPKTSGQSPIVRQTTEVRAGDDPLTRGDPTPWPAVDAYLRLSAKPTADVSLQTAGGDPLLAWWRVGAGFAATLAVGPGDPAAASLTRDPRFASLLATLVRGNGSAADPLRIRPIVRSAGVEIDVVATTQSDASPLTLSVQDAAGGMTRTMIAQPVAPGHWNVLLNGLPAATYVLDAESALGHARAAVAVNAPHVMSSVRADETLLARLAGYAAAAKSVALDPASGKWTDGRPAVVTAAVLVLLAQVAVRRWPGSKRRPA